MDTHVQELLSFTSAEYLSLPRSLMPEPINPPWLVMQVFISEKARIMRDSVETLLLLYP